MIKRAVNIEYCEEVVEGIVKGGGWGKVNLKFQKLSNGVVV